MKKLIAFTMLSVMLLYFLQESAAQDFKQISGDWKFNTPEAAYGYQTGTITFSEQESEFKGEEDNFPFK